MNRTINKTIRDLKKYMDRYTSSSLTYLKSTKNILREKNVFRVQKKLIPIKYF